MGMPDFTADQRKWLVSLGVVPEQVKQLRLALIEVQCALFPTPARNDVQDTLVEVAKQSDKLAQLLGKLALRIDAKRSAACTAIEIGYWQRRPGDDGVTSMHHLIPRLSALADAARDGMKALPSGQTRRRSANWTPIRAIENALLLGWSREHGAAVRSGHAHVPVPKPQPYPRKFRPSELTTSTFSKVAGLCYEAAGAPRDTEPRAAIRAYLKVKTARHQAMHAGIEKALQEPVQ